jgi:hypothetical protein
MSERNYDFRTHLEWKIGCTRRAMSALDSPADGPSA